MTILVSTPYMDEAVRCETVSLIQEGVIMATDSPERILKNFSSSLFEIKTENRFRLLRLLRSMREVKSAYLFGQFIHATMTSPKADPNWLHEQITRQGIADAEIVAIQANFEDCFIRAIEDNPRKT